MMIDASKAKSDIGRGYRCPVNEKRKRDAPTGQAAGGSLTGITGSAKGRGDPAERRCPGVAAFYPLGRLHPRPVTRLNGTRQAHWRHSYFPLGMRMTVGGSVTREPGMGFLIDLGLIGHGRFGGPDRCGGRWKHSVWATGFACSMGFLTSDDDPWEGDQGDWWDLPNKYP
jgi:hypothetical protein